MKSSVLISGLTSLSSFVNGIPTLAPGAAGAALNGPHGSLSRRLLFDTMASPVEVTGDHAFIAPDFSAGDQRGPCPGLNALANHGYISRDGVAGLAEVTSAINSVFGMGLDLGSLLAIMGTVFVGDVLSLNPGFSIGNADPGAQSLLDNGLGLLGTPRGLNGSHNIIEGDSSNTRQDLYQTGDASTMDLSQFKALHDMFPEEEVPAFDIFAERASIRFKETVSTDPNFYYGPFTGFIARNAGYLFPNRLFANYSADRPEGVMTRDILKSFYGVEGEGDNMTYNKGHERIPENWYRTPIDYGLMSFNLDLINLTLKYPELASIGGNLGSVNNFAGLDLGNITGGVLNSVSLLEGNNLLCFVFEVVKLAAPNILSNIFATIAGPLETLTDAIGSAVLNMSCPAFDDLTVGGKDLATGLGDMFPGAGKSGSVL